MRTNVDIVADLKREQVDAFVAGLRDAFYVDGDMIRDAIRRLASFNVVHLKTMLKVDVFVHRRDTWSLEEMARARTESIDSVDVRFATPEDTILHKLIWFRLGQGVSERQWSDVLGVLKVQRGKLDEVYLDHWADALDLIELMARARSAS